MIGLGIAWDRRLWSWVPVKAQFGRTQVTLWLVFWFLTDSGKPR